jgi:hypothetical protein
MAVLLTLAPISVALVVARPVAAECDGPIPSFREAAPNATTILIGDVTAVRHGGLTDGDEDGRWSRYTLKVRHVVRGVAPGTMAIRDLQTTGCAPGIIVHQGDRIAIAFDVHAPGMVPFNAAAWIVGEPAYASLKYDSHFEVTTTDAVFRLAGKEAPETSTLSPGSAEGDSPSLVEPWTWIEFMLVASGVTFVMLANRKRV